MAKPCEVMLGRKVVRNSPAQLSEEYAESAFAQARAQMNTLMAGGGRYASIQAAVGAPSYAAGTGGGGSKKKKDKDVEPITVKTEDILEP